MKNLTRLFTLLSLGAAAYGAQKVLQTRKTEAELQQRLASCEPSSRQMFRTAYQTKLDFAREKRVHNGLVTVIGASCAALGLKKLLKKPALKKD